MHPPDLWTLSAIAVTAFAVTLLAFHLGQSLTYWSFTGESLPASMGLGEQFERLQAGQYRVVRAAGAAVNLVLALILYPAVRPLRDQDPGVGLFSWLAATLNGVVASAYPIVSTAVNRGDWAWLTVGVESVFAWKITIFFGGAMVLTAAVWRSRTLGEVFLGRGSNRRSISNALASTSCFTWIGASVLVLLVHPAGFNYAIVAPVMALTGAGGLAAVLLRSRLPRARTPHRPDPIERSVAWLMVGVVSSVALVSASSAGFLH